VAFCEVVEHFGPCLRPLVENNSFGIAKSVTIFMASTNNSLMPLLRSSILPFTWLLCTCGPSSRASPMTQFQSSKHLPPNSRHLLVDQAFTSTRNLQSRRCSIIDSTTLRFWSSVSSTSHAETCDQILAAPAPWKARFAANSIQKAETK
jgi:hypothetical protein